MPDPEPAGNVPGKGTVGGKGSKAPTGGLVPAAGSRNSPGHESGFGRTDHTAAAGSGCSEILARQRQKNEPARLAGIPVDPGLAAWCRLAGETLLLRRFVYSIRISN